MAAELITPTDELTGLPLPILLPETFDLNKTNWHHLVHPEASPQLKSMGGWAIRNCLLQVVPEELHNMSAEGYHQLFKGPPLPGPEDANKHFMWCVLTCAGYLPDAAIDMRSKDPTKPVKLSESEYQRYRMKPVPIPITERDVSWYRARKAPEASPREAWRALSIHRKRQANFGYQYFRYSYEPIRDFFREFLLEQQIDIKPRVIKRFLTTKDELKRRSLADTILATAAAQATSDIQFQYRQLRTAGVLHPKMPEKPEKIVFFKLGNYTQRLELLPRLEALLQESIS